MTGTGSVPQEPATVAPPEGGAHFSLFGILVSAMNSIGTALIFVLMIMINADAFGRTLFAAPVNGVNEMIELSLVGIVFLQLADTTRCGRLTRSDGFFKWVMTHRPAIGRYMGAAFDLLGALFMAAIVFGSIPLLIDAVKNDHFVGNEGIFTFPVWPVKTIIVVGCIVALLQFLIFVWRYLGGGRHPSEGT